MKSRKTVFYALALVGSFATGFTVSHVGFNGVNTEVSNLIPDNWDAQRNELTANVNLNNVDNSNSLWIRTSCTRPNIKNTNVCNNASSARATNTRTSSSPA